MAKIVGNPTVTPMAVPDWNQTDSTRADYIKNKPDIYTKTAVNARLDRKADKADIENMCKYKGSVSSASLLPYEVVFEVNGPPVDDNGNEIGSYDFDTGRITFNHHKLPQNDGHIRIPVSKKTLATGYYACGRIDLGSISVLNESDGDNDIYIDHYIGDINCTPLAERVLLHEVSELVISYSNESDTPVIINGTYKITGQLSKVAYLGDLTIHEPLAIGHMYNVSDTDTNYIWTGTEWDALGGSVSDESVKEDIDKINTELNKKADKSEIEQIESDLADLKSQVGNHTLTSKILDKVFVLTPASEETTLVTEIVDNIFILDERSV